MSKDISFMGFETWFNNLRMVLKMQMYMLLILFLLQIVSMVILAKYSLTEVQASVILAYLKSLVVLDKNATTSVTINGKLYMQTYSAIQDTYLPYVQKYLNTFVSKAIWTFLIYLLWFPMNMVFRRRAKSQITGKYLRGAVLISPKELNELTKKEETFLHIGEVNMPVSAEVKHMLIIGRPGVGKTVCMSAILDKINKRENRAIIHDFKGDYLQKFYRPDRDIIFNPFDTRSHYWNFFDEIETPMDVDAVGYALIPDAKGAGMDPFWNNAARDVFNGVVNHLIQHDKRSYNDLHRLVTAQSDVIGNALKYTQGSEAGATAIADPESKQTGSIMSVMTQYTKIFAYMREIQGVENRKRFVINDWLNDDNAGNIYITNYSTMQDTLAPILTLMIDLMGRKLLSLPDSSKRRIFFLLDEFGALQKMQTITRLLTLARSKGGGVFLGIQDLGQIDKIYGREHKQTIVNACGSSVVFSVADSETSETLSKKYGEYLSIESYVTQSMGVDNNRDGLSINQQKSKERIVLSSEIASLPDLNCYVQFPGSPVAKTFLTYRSYPDLNEPLKKRTDLNYTVPVACVSSQVIPTHDERTGEIIDNQNSKYETEEIQQREVKSQERELSLSNTFNRSLANENNDNNGGKD